MIRTLVDASYLLLATFAVILLITFFLVLTRPAKEDKGPVAAFRRRTAAWFRLQVQNFKRRRHEKRSAKEVTRLKPRLYRFEDYLFNPITWTLFLGLCIFVISFLLAWIPYFGFEWMVASSYLKSNPVTGTATLVLWAVLFVLLCLPQASKGSETAVLEVPGPNYGALLTWAGMVLPAFLTTGKYPWTGRLLGFGWLKVKSETIANAEGFVNLGDITFQVWNSASATDAKDKSIIALPAKNRAPVKGSLTLILERVKPRLWLDAQDAGLDVGERARQEYQEIIEHLIDTDVAAVQSVMSDWMIGEKFITSFITKNTPHHKAGAIIRDERGLVMITRVGEHDPNEKVEDARRRFIADLYHHADTDMLKAITKEVEVGGIKAKELSLSEIQASSPITEVIEERGYKLKRVTYGDISLSTKVTEAAEQASAEADERRSQMDSASTNAEVRKLLMPTPEELANPELYQLTTILAAAQDDKSGNVKVIMVPGGSKLTTGLMAAATHAGGTKP